MLKHVEHEDIKEKLLEEDKEIKESVKIFKTDTVDFAKNKKR